jgi:cytochrome c biogenesis protein
VETIARSAGDGFADSRFRMFSPVARPIRNRLASLQPLRSAKRLLRSPAFIVGEILAITLACVLGASLPQAGTASRAELARLRAAGPVVAALVETLELDHVFRSVWFLGLTLLAAASLSIVIAEQIRRLRVTWSQRPTEAQLRAAPLRVEFERPSRLPAGDVAAAATVDIRTSGRLALAGSPIFHAGLMLVVVAGALRALFAADAVVDLIEGETLATTAEAWSGQWPGMMAAPFRLGRAVRLDEVVAKRYESGALQDLTVRLSLDRGRGPEEAEIAVNRELRASGGRLFLGADFGPAALLEWRAPDDVSAREAVLLASRGKGTYEAASGGPDGLRVFLRAEVDRTGRRPDRLDVRVVRVTGDGRFPLLFAGLVPAGGEVAIPGGRMLRLHGVPFWARLRGNRDPALGLAYAGFALVLAGATIMFTVVKVDTCVVITPTAGGERVFVALRAHRFVPLFHERFARLVREQGGPT